MCFFSDLWGLCMYVCVVVYMHMCVWCICTEFLCIVLAGTCSEDQTGLELRDQPASASRVLGLKACTTTTTTQPVSVLQAENNRCFYKQPGSSACWLYNKPVSSSRKWTCNFLMAFSLTRAMVKVCSFSPRNGVPY